MSQVFVHEDYGYEEPAESSAPSSPSDEDHAFRPSTRTARRRRGARTSVENELSFHPGRFTLYSRPRQRQSWGDPQVLPRVDWGDLFFDLFYVAATYNVSYILVDAPSGRGLLYACGTFWPIMSIWIEKTYYDARFVTEDDLVHRLYVILTLVVLATAILNIRTVEDMSQPSQNTSMVVFCLALVVERLLYLVRQAELYKKGIGQKSVIKRMASREALTRSISIVGYAAALGVAASEYFGNDGSGRRLADTTTLYDVSYDKDDTNNIPIALVLGSFVFSQLLFCLEVIFCLPTDGRHKEMWVPINVDFVLHRNGEWIMLMLGESVFSLLIVDIPNEGRDFFITFYCGILTVVFLQYLHFRSQPHSADHHALRRHKNAGIGWSLLKYVYSLALVSLGAAFTFFLTHAEDQDQESASRIDYENGSGNYTGNSTYDDPGHRWLAASSTSDEYDQKSVLQNAANLFSASLAVIFFSIDVMTLFHLGIKESQGRCTCPKKNTKNRKRIVFCLLRLGLIVFTATLSQWETEPQTLSMIGVACVLAQLVLRKLGIIYLHHKCVGAEEEHPHKGHEDDNDAAWPNVTHARAERSHNTPPPETSEDQ